MTKFLNFKKIKDILFNLVVFFLQQIIAILMVFPYLFYKVVIVNGQEIKNQGLPFILRKILELRTY